MSLLLTSNPGGVTYMSLLLNSNPGVGYIHMPNRFIVTF